MAAKSVPLVEEFVSVTGASKERAGSLLEACNGNLGMAIEMHFDSCSEMTSIAGNSASASASKHANEIDKDADDVRAPIPQTRGVLVEEPYHTFTTRKRTSQSVFDAFRDFQAEAKQQETVGASSSLKRKTLQDLFRPPIDLLHKGTFETAKLDGQQHGKWLLVNVQDVKEFACQQLNRDVWSNDAVRTVVKEHFVLWQVYKDSGEGERFIHFYHVESFPSLTVLDPRTGEKLVEWNAATSPQAFCECATEFTLLHPSFDGDTPPSKKRKRESIVDASEDSQLKAAIAASLTYTKSENDCKSSSDKEGDDDDDDDDNDDDDDDDDDMGFSDSSSEGQPSPKKTSTLNRSKVRGTIPAKEEPKTSNASRRTFKGTFPKLASQTNPTSPKGSNVAEASRGKKEAEASSVGKILDKASSTSEEIHEVGTSKASKLGSSKASSKSRGTREVGPSKASKVGPSKASSTSEGTHEVGTSKASSKSEGTHEVGPSKASKARPSRATSKSEGPDEVEPSKASSKSKGTHEVGPSKASSKNEGTPEQNSVGDVETSEDNTDSDKNGTGGERPQEHATGDLCKIMVRFPSGTREAVSLSAEATIMALVNFVEKQGYPNERFELVTNFPRRKLSYLDFKTTLRAAGLYPQEAVFVQER